MLSRKVSYLDKLSITSVDDKKSVKCTLHWSDATEKIKLEMKLIGTWMSDKLEAWKKNTAQRKESESLYIFVLSQKWIEPLIFLSYNDEHE